MFKLKLFEEFLNEAISEKDIKPALEKISGYLSKKLGEKLYEYPDFEDWTKEDGTKGTGKRFYTESGKSIRLNSEDAEDGRLEITSVDYWGGDSKEPVWTVDGYGQSLATILPKVADLLMKGDETYAESSNESFIGEAEVPASKIEKIKSLAEDGMSAKSIADKLGLTPRAVRQVLKDDGVVGAGRAQKEKRKEPEDVTDQIFKSEALLKDKVKLLDEIMEDIADVTKAVALGNVNGLMISGKAGTGKTFTVTNALDKSKAEYNVITGSASTPGIVKELYKYNGGILVFDDCDSVFDDQESRNIFKAALDTKKVRTVSYKKQNAAFYDPDKVTSPEQLEAYEAEGRIPNTFEFTGRIIFISNLKKEKLDPDGAIRSRSLIIDVSPDDMTIMERMKVMLKDIEPEDMPLKEKEEVFQYIKNSKNVSMRTFVKAAKFKQSGIKNWQRILERYI
jgi:predicted transcriptional regulator